MAVCVMAATTADTICSVVVCEMVSKAVCVVMVVSMIMCMVVVVMMCVRWVR